MAVRLLAVKLRGCWDLGVKQFNKWLGAVRHSQNNGINWSLGLNGCLSCPWQGMFFGGDSLEMMLDVLLDPTDC